MVGQDSQVHYNSVLVYGERDAHQQQQHEGAHLPQSSQGQRASQQTSAPNFDSIAAQVTPFVNFAQQNQQVQQNGRQTGLSASDIARAPSHLLAAGAEFQPVSWTIGEDTPDAHNISQPVASPSHHASLVIHVADQEAVNEDGTTPGQMSPAHAHASAATIDLSPPALLPELVHAHEQQTSVAHVPDSAPSLQTWQGGSNLAFNGLAADEHVLQPLLETQPESLPQGFMMTGGDTDGQSVDGNHVQNWQQNAGIQTPTGRSDGPFDPPGSPQGLPAASLQFPISPRMSPSPRSQSAVLSLHQPTDMSDINVYNTAGNVFGPNEQQAGPGVAQAAGDQEPITDNRITASSGMPGRPSGSKKFRVCGHLVTQQHVIRAVRDAISQLLFVAALAADIAVLAVLAHNGWPPGWWVPTLCFILVPLILMGCLLLSSNGWLGLCAHYFQTLLYSEARQVLDQHWQSMDWMRVPLMSMVIAIMAIFGGMVTAYCIVCFALTAVGCVPLLDTSTMLAVLLPFGWPTFKQRDLLLIEQYKTTRWMLQLFIQSLPQLIIMSVLLSVDEGSLRNGSKIQAGVRDTTILPAVVASLVIAALNVIDKSWLLGEQLHVAVSQDLRSDGTMRGKWDRLVAWVRAAGAGAALEDDDSPDEDDNASMAEQMSEADPHRMAWLLGGLTAGQGIVRHFSDLLRLQGAQKVPPAVMESTLSHMLQSASHFVVGPSEGLATWPEEDTTDDLSHSHPPPLGHPASVAEMSQTSNNSRLTRRPSSLRSVPIAAQGYSIRRPSAEQGQHGVVSTLREIRLTLVPHFLRPPQSCRLAPAQVLAVVREAMLRYPRHAITTWAVESPPGPGCLSGVILDGLARFKALQQLTICKCQVSGQGFRRVLRQLATHPALSDVRLVQVSIDSKAADTLAESIRSSTRVTRLELRHASMPAGTSGMKAFNRLARAMKSNTSITALTLSQCGLTRQSLQALCSALTSSSSHSVLRFLDVSDNSLGLAGAQLLVDLIGATRLAAGTAAPHRTGSARVAHTAVPAVGSSPVTPKATSAISGLLPWNRGTRTAAHHSNEQDGRPDIEQGQLEEQTVEQGYSTGGRQYADRIEGASPRAAQSLVSLENSQTSTLFTLVVGQGDITTAGAAMVVAAVTKRVLSGHGVPNRTTGGGEAVAGLLPNLSLQRTSVGSVGKNPLATLFNRTSVTNPGQSSNPGAAHTTIIVADGEMTSQPNIANRSAVLMGVPDVELGVIPEHPPGCFGRLFASNTPVTTVPRTAVPLQPVVPVLPFGPRLVVHVTPTSSMPGSGRATPSNSQPGTPSSRPPRPQPSPLPADVSFAEPSFSPFLQLPKLDTNGDGNVSTSVEAFAGSASNDTVSAGTHMYVRQLSGPQPQITNLTLPSAATTTTAAQAGSSNVMPAKQRSWLRSRHRRTHSDTLPTVGLQAAANILTPDTANTDSAGRAVNSEAVGSSTAPDKGSKIAKMASSKGWLKRRPSFGNSTTPDQQQPPSSPIGTPEPMTAALLGGGNSNIATPTWILEQEQLLADCSPPPMAPPAPGSVSFKIDAFDATHVPAHGLPIVLVAHPESPAFSGIVLPSSNNGNAARPQPRPSLREVIESFVPATTTTTADSAVDATTVQPEHPQHVVTATTRAGQQAVNGVFTDTHGMGLKEGVRLVLVCDGALNLPEVDTPALATRISALHAVNPASIPVGLPRVLCQSHRLFGAYLTSLELSNLGIGDAGAFLLADLLMNAPGLRSLSVVNNHIGDAGASALINAVLSIAKLPGNSPLSPDDTNTVAEAATRADGAVTGEANNTVEAGPAANSAPTSPRGGLYPAPSVVQNPPSTQTPYPFRSLDLSGNTVCDESAVALVNLIEGLNGDRRAVAAAALAAVSAADAARHAADVAAAAHAQALAEHPVPSRRGLHFGWGVASQVTAAAAEMKQAEAAAQTARAQALAAITQLAAALQRAPLVVHMRDNHYPFTMATLRNLQTALASAAQLPAPLQNQFSAGQSNGTASAMAGSSSYSRQNSQENTSTTNLLTDPPFNPTPPTCNQLLMMMLSRVHFKPSMQLLFNAAPVESAAPSPCARHATDSRPAVNGMSPGQLNGSPAGQTSQLTAHVVAAARSARHSRNVSHTFSEMSDAEGCGVCFENPNNLTIKPCGHKLCVSCYRQLVKPEAAPRSTATCPFCRSGIQGFEYRVGGLGFDTRWMSGNDAQRRR